MKKEYWLWFIILCLVYCEILSVYMLQKNYNTLEKLDYQKVDKIIISKNNLSVIFRTEDQTYYEWDGREWKKVIIEPPVPPKLRRLLSR